SDAFSFSCRAGHHALHSFPTRRSSDLSAPAPKKRDDLELDLGPPAADLPAPLANLPSVAAQLPAKKAEPAFGEIDLPSLDAPLRSEEHTSELQSESNLVCRLLLEKKKN